MTTTPERHAATNVAHAEDVRPASVRTAGTFLLCLLLAAFAAGLASAHDLNFQHYGIGDGLPQTQVRTVHQDAHGFLWVGTYGGLGKYDGRGFTVFSTDDGLNSNNITAVTDTADTLWAGTISGLCFLRDNEHRFRCLQDPSLAHAHVTALLPDAVDGVWIGTEEGLFRVDHHLHVQSIDPPTAEQLEVTSLALTPENVLRVGTRRGLFELRQGKLVENPQLPKDAGGSVKALLQDGDTLWIGAIGGLFVLRDGAVTPAPGLPATWTQDDINSLARGRDGSIWAATDQGVLWRDERSFDLLTAHDGLMSNVNFAVAVDREGVVWIGNDDGLSKYVPGPFTGYLEDHGLLHYFVRSISEDTSGRLWLGTRNGVQVVPFDNGDWRFDRSLTITSKDGLVDPRVYSIALPSPHEAYIATGNGVAHWRQGGGILKLFTHADGLPSNATQALKLQGGRLWIGTNLGVRFLEDGRIFTPDDAELAEAYVYRIREDARGRLWFGTQDQGIFVRDTDGAMSRLGREQGLTDETVWDIAAESDGGVWIGSNGDGLFHVTADGTIRRYTMKDGLVDNFVWQVLVDDQGVVWSYTNRGISRFDGQRFKSYGEDDGLLHLEGGATGALQTHDGQLWFASADGLMRYDPTQEHHNDLPPVVVIQEALFGNRHITDGAELPFLNENLSFQYAALSFQSEDNLRYKYRLRGNDDSWSEPVPYRPITYGSLGAGRYVFEVMARNPDGVWSEQPAQFRFRILPPFWKTAWFWSLATTGIALTLFAAYHVRVRHMHARRRDLERLVARRTEELESANEQLKAASLIDPLTGLHNRRFLVSQIATDLAQSRRAHRAPSTFPNRDVVFMMVDIDHFKSINDTHGHGAGDKVLRSYAKLLRAQVRESDYVVRWGGEEFLIVARQTESEQSDVIAERIMKAARAMQFEIDDGKTVSCTCSIGVSHYPFLPEAPELFNWEQIIDIADMAVYMAKANGRNGWVAIHGADASGFEDGITAVRRFREDMAACIASGSLSVSSSFGDGLHFTLSERRRRESQRT